MEKNCNWCNPNDQGMYNAALFKDAQHPDQSITMFFNGGDITLQVELPGQDVGHMTKGINYCPMCGRRVRAEQKEV